MTDERNLALLNWYDASDRSFPWRSTCDPYRILISEVMSQQTQIGRVVERYGRFLDRFPTVQDLADSQLGDVLAEWSGLGYNRRAMNLHAAARIVAADGWPESAADLIALPGIGPYTAAAVASICFDEPTPAIDTNLRRVLGRWNGAALADNAARAFANPLIDRERPGDWNQAVMDLGGSICTPRDPACTSCPVEPWCEDATIYVVPRPQGTFKGSSREARGAVIRELTNGPATLQELAMRSGLAPDRIKISISALIEETLVEESPPHYRLPTRPSTNYQVPST